MSAPRRNIKHQNSAKPPLVPNTRHLQPVQHADAPMLRDDG
jgi:hypothetical protein